MADSKFILYTATTLDGFIAREDGNLDWLHAMSNPNQIDHGYYGFYSQIDTVVMGNKTYQEVLGFDVGWPYENCTSYIISRNKQLELSTPNTRLINELNKEMVEKIRAGAEKDIWVVGGGQIIAAFLNLSKLDEMILTIIPTLLGKGIPLFPGELLETGFELVSTSAFETGAVNLHYRRKGSNSIE